MSQFLPLIFLIDIPLKKEYIFIVLLFVKFIILYFVKGEKKEKKTLFCPFCQKNNESFRICLLNFIL